VNTQRRIHISSGLSYPHILMQSSGKSLSWYPKALTPIWGGHSAKKDKLMHSFENFLGEKWLQLITSLAFFPVKSGSGAFAAKWVEFRVDANASVGAGIARAGILVLCWLCEKNNWSQLVTQSHCHCLFINRLSVIFSFLICLHSSKYVTSFRPRYLFQVWCRSHNETK